jgi:hypothetical protein
LFKTNDKKKKSHITYREHSKELQQIYFQKQYQKTSLEYWTEVGELGDPVKPEFYTQGKYLSKLKVRWIFFIYTRAQKTQDRRIFKEESPLRNVNDIRWNINIYKRRALEMIKNKLGNV